MLVYHAWQYIFLHVLRLYSCQLFVNSKNNKCETCDIVFFECMLLNIKLVFPDLDWKLAGWIFPPIQNGLFSLKMILKHSYFFCYIWQNSKLHGAGSFLITQSETLHLFWNPKLHYCVYNSLPPYCIMSQSSPIHILLQHVLGSI